MADKRPTLLSTLYTIADRIKACNEAGVSLHFSHTMKINDTSKELEDNPQKQLELEKLSDKYRKEGNSFFKQGLYVHAYQVYTRGIACALHGPVCAMSYADRSDALFQMARFKACLLDIERAISNGYQEKNRLYQLYLRQARCLKYLCKDYKESMERAIQAIQMHNKDDLETLKQVVERGIKLGAPEPNPKAAEYHRGGVMPTLSHGVSKEVPCFSSAVAVAYNKQLGRHLVASKDIEAGEVLIKEEPIAAVVDMDKTNKVCCKCFKISYSLIPCNKCRQFMYCSDECKELDWEDGHKDECEMVNQLLASAINLKPHELFFGYEKRKFTIPCLVLSMMTHLLGLEKMKDAVAKNEEMGPSHSDDRRRGFDKEGKFTFSLEALLSLTDNFGKLKQEEMLAIVNYATQCVMHTSSWKNESAEVKDGLTALFVKLYLIAVFNYKPITITCNFDKKEIMQGQKPKWCHSEVGFGLYLASSLINHSCSPNMHKVSYGTTLVYFASRNIKKGEQLTGSLYLNYLKDKMKLRQEVLHEHYRFTCKCVACTKNWPVAERLNEINRQKPSYSSGLSSILMSCAAANRWGEAEMKKMTNCMTSGFPFGEDMKREMLCLLRVMYVTGEHKNHESFCYQIQQCLMMGISISGSSLLSKNAQDILSCKRKFHLTPSLDDQYKKQFEEYTLAEHVPLNTQV